MKDTLIKSLIYISQGNIPSKWAHTFQAMKQAEAMSGMFKSFTFLTSGRLISSPMSRSDLFEWYGISQPFRLRRLPVFWNINGTFFNSDRYPRFDRVAAWYARLAKPGLVYTRSPGAAKHCLEYGLPVIFETHAPDDYDIKFIRPLAESETFLGLVTISENLKLQYSQLGIPDSKIFVAPDAVDVRRFNDHSQNGTARAEIGTTENRPVVMYAGHFYPEKGVDTLLAAAGLLSGIEFHLVGGWPDDIKRLRQKYARLGNVQFHGFVPNQAIPSYLAAADDLVLPNSGKYPDAKITSPLKLYEYLASGKPVIASDIPALRGVVADGENVFTFTPDCSNDLARVIEKAFSDSLATKAVAEAGREVAELSTWDNRARGILRNFNLSTIPE